MNPKEFNKLMLDRKTSLLKPVRRQIMPIVRRDTKLKVQLQPLLQNKQSQKCQNPPKITLQNRVEPNKKSRPLKHTRSSPEQVKPERRLKPSKER